MRGVGATLREVARTAEARNSAVTQTPLIRQAPPATFSHKGIREKESPIRLKSPVADRGVWHRRMGRLADCQKISEGAHEEGGEARFILEAGGDGPGGDGGALVRR